MQEPSVRPEPVEACPEGPRRGPSPPTPHVSPAAPTEGQGQAGPSPTLFVMPAHPPRSFLPTLFVIPAHPPRHSCEGRNPEGRRRGGPSSPLSLSSLASRSHPRLSPTPCRRGGSRTARPAAAGPSTHRHQHPRRPTPPLVVPANAGIQGRGAAWGVSVRPRIPPLPTVCALPDSVRPEPVEGPLQRPRSRPTPTVGAVREPPVPPESGIHPPDTCPLAPTPTPQLPFTHGTSRRHSPRYRARMEVVRNLLEQTLARTVRIDGRMRFGSQQQGIVSTPRSVLAFAL